MRQTVHEYVISGAVLFGALVLFGPVTYLAVGSAAGILLGLAGLRLSGGLAVLVWGGAALLALRVVMEVTRLRLRGFDALDRTTGGRRVVRHLVLLVPVLAVVVVAVDLLANVGRWALDSGRFTTVAVAALLALALAAGVGRSALAFGRGFRNAR